MLGRKFEPVAIGMLERFVADYTREARRKRGESHSTGAGAYCTPGQPTARVAVIGSGPAGLTCAAELAACGYAVDVFESLHDTGGVLRYGIPEFRLPKRIIDEEVEYVKSLRANIITNVVVGMTVNLNELLESGQCRRHL